MITIIAAIGINNELGKGNKLIWNIPKDLVFFKEKTANSTIVMGSNTFNSLPRILPGRKHIILSTKHNFNKELNENVEVISEKQNLFKLCLETGEKEEIFIIGGASIYSMFIDIADRMYITHIKEEDKDADAYFPVINPNVWEKTILTEDTDNGISFTHVKYDKIIDK